MSKVYCKSFFSELRKLKKDIYEKKDSEAGKVYVSVEKFVLGCSYTNYKEAPKFVQFLIQGYTDSHIAQYFGIKEASVRWRETEDLGKKLYAIFGVDFFELMKDYSANRKKIDRVLYVATNSGNNRNECITTEISNYVMGEMDGKSLLEEIDLSECRGELSFLAKHSIPTLHKEMEGLDISKLEYLMRVLDGTAGSIDDRYNFMCLMKEQ